MGKEKTVLLILGGILILLGLLLMIPYKTWGLVPIIIGVFAIIKGMKPRKVGKKEEHLKAEKKPEKEEDEEKEVEVYDVEEEPEEEPAEEEPAEEPEAEADKEEEFMFCRECGEKIPKEEFCPECGAKQ